MPQNPFPPSDPTISPYDPNYYADDPNYYAAMLGGINVPRPTTISSPVSVAPQGISNSNSIGYGYTTPIYQPAATSSLSDIYARGSSAPAGTITATGVTSPKSIATFPLARQGEVQTPQAAAQAAYDSANGYGAGWTTPQYGQTGWKPEANATAAKQAAIYGKFFNLIAGNSDLQQRLVNNKPLTQAEFTKLVTGTPLGTYKGNYQQFQDAWKTWSSIPRLTDFSQQRDVPNGQYFIDPAGALRVGGEASSIQPASSGATTTTPTSMTLLKGSFAATPPLVPPSEASKYGVKITQNGMILTPKDGSTPRYYDINGNPVGTDAQGKPMWPANQTLQVVNNAMERSPTGVTAPANIPPTNATAPVQAAAGGLTAAQQDSLKQFMSDYGRHINDFSSNMAKYGDPLKGMPDPYRDTTGMPVAQAQSFNEYKAAYEMWRNNVEGSDPYATPKPSAMPAPVPKPTATPDQVNAYVSQAEKTRQQKMNSLTNASGYSINNLMRDMQGANLTAAAGSGPAARNAAAQQANTARLARINSWINDTLKSTTAGQADQQLARDLQYVNSLKPGAKLTTGQQALLQQAQMRINQRMKSFTSGQ